MRLVTRIADRGRVTLSKKRCVGVVKETPEGREELQCVNVWRTKVGNIEGKVAMQQCKVRIYMYGAAVSSPWLATKYNMDRCMYLQLPSRGWTLSMSLGFLFIVRSDMLGMDESMLLLRSALRFFAVCWKEPVCCVAMVLDGICLLSGSRLCRFLEIVVAGEETIYVFMFAEALKALSRYTTASPSQGNAKAKGKWPYIVHEP